MWEQFLDVARYPRAKYLISKEACNITRYLIRGLVSLIVIYRDHVPETYPLLPWLHSTEICEHVFGLCRQIQQDFTLLDFLYMVPKLSIRLREHALLGHFSDGKERAHGYNHTYSDFRGVDLVNLSTYPTDLDINDALQESYRQAEHLWSILGVVPPFGGAPQLPSIRSWFTEDDPSSDTTGDPEYESAVEDANTR